MTRRRGAAAALALAAIAAAAMAGAASAMSVRVAANAEECFFESPSRGEKLLASYSVSAGGQLDINVRVSAPDGTVVYEEERVSEGILSFVALQEGSHAICFSNAMSTVTDKVVAFTVYSGSSISMWGVASDEHFTPLENSVLGLAEGLRKVRNDQKYIKFRTRAMSRTTNSTSSRVVFWQALQTIALVAVGVWQTLYVRSLFDPSK